MNMKPDCGIFLAERKVVQFFADKVVLFLSLLIVSFIVLDSFINLLPYGNGTVNCFIEQSGVTPGQQAYINGYCTDHVPRWTYAIPIVMFGHGLLTVLLHYSWYSTVLYVRKFRKSAGDKEGAAGDKEGASGDKKGAAGDEEGDKKGAAGDEEGATGDMQLENFVAATDEPKLNPKQGPICLLICYCFKNILQIGLGVTAVSLSFDYEWNPHTCLAPVNRSFPCPIKGNIDYWEGLDTLQCFYNSVAVKDVFIVFYGIMSICVVLAATFGLVDICTRSDLKNKWCKCWGCLCKKCSCWDSLCTECKKKKYICWENLCPQCKEKYTCWDGLCTKYKKGRDCCIKCNIKSNIRCFDYCCELAENSDILEYCLEKEKDTSYSSFL